MNTVAKTFFVTGIVWLVSVCGQAAGWGASGGLAPPGGTTMGEVQQIGSHLGQRDISVEERVTVICCDPRDRVGRAAEQPSLPIDPKVRASMQALEDCMVSLVRLKKEMRSARLALGSSAGREAAELREILETSLQRQEDYLNETIHLYNALFRTLSALFEELYADVGPR